mmetsp:Transcript_17243/g.37204  ORF Transcript_17243/g.37204 Transcript_17243/m.37204 type:complete len:249 (-) Transcript_17243:176-922(-)
MANMRARATRVFWPPLSCLRDMVSPPGVKQTLTLTPVYFSSTPPASLLPAATSSSSSPAGPPAPPGSRFCITRSPRPPGTSSANTSLKFLATPLNVRSMASSLRMSSAPISSRILDSEVSTSAFFLSSSAHCSMKPMCCSSALRFTLPYLDRSAFTLWSSRCSSLTLRPLYFSNASAGRLPSSLTLRCRSSCLCCRAVRLTDRASRARPSSATAASLLASASPTASSLLRRSARRVAAVSCRPSTSTN